MSLKSRLVLIAVILGVTLAVQYGLTWHMRSGDQADYAELRKPISELPLTIPLIENKANTSQNGIWIGMANDHEKVIRSQLPFIPDGLLSRTYGLRDTSLALSLYMVYSRKAEDRKHHPEVCIRDVTGAAEDLAARKILFVGSDQKRPVQRFRFRTSSTHYTTVYYWHFTLPRMTRSEETVLQVLHQQMSRSAPSITVQVSTTAEVKQLEPIESVFLPSLDQLLQESYLPKGTVMGCDRVPVVLLTR